MLVPSAAAAAAVRSIVVNRIAQVRALECRRHLAELDTLFASLQSRAFSGDALSHEQLRVDPGPVPADRRFGPDRPSRRSTRTLGPPASTCGSRSSPSCTGCTGTIRRSGCRTTTASGRFSTSPASRTSSPKRSSRRRGRSRRSGNQAVHNPRPIRQYDALQVTKELHHICYWLVRTYQPDAPRDGAAWKDERVPTPVQPGDVVPRA